VRLGDHASAAVSRPRPRPAGDAAEWRPLTQSARTVSLEAKDRRFEVKEFRCGALVPGCWATFEGESEDEILRQVVVHAREEHGMDQVPPEVVDEIRAGISERGPR
jgi:predicted small metal-binding protein